MGNEITIQPRGLVPSNIEEAYRMAKAFAMAQMLPKSYGSGDLDVMTAKAFTAMQLGAEVGMAPMQSIQSIAVVNGMPSIWGDAQKALVISSPLCEYIKETFEGEPYDDNYKAICKTKRVGHDEVIAEFSVADAKAAQLWTKTGTWQTHKKRMMQYKARSFALRDAFPDVLKGLTHSAEEMDGVEDVTPYNAQPKVKPERKEATAINDILAEQSKIGSVTLDLPITQEVVVNKEDTITRGQVGNAAKDRADKIAALLYAADTAAELRQIVRDNDTHITMLPGSIGHEVYEAIAVQKDRLGIAPGDDLLAG